MMGAGLQCDIGSGTPGRFTGLVKRNRFSMGTSAPAGPAAAHNMPGLIDKNTANSRIWRHIAKPSPRKSESRLHHVTIKYFLFVQISSLRDYYFSGSSASVPTNSSKSLASRKFL